MNRSSKFSLDWIQKSGFCHIRFVPYHPKTVLGVFDKKELLIIEDPRKDLSESPALWTNNLSLINAIQDYFSVLWVTALDEPEYWVDNGQIPN